MFLNSYLLLALGIIFEVAGTMLLPLSQNFTKILPTVGLAVFYMASFYCLTFSLKVIPIGVLYATWSGMGIFIITVLGYFIYRQSVNWQTILGLCLIIIGVILVNSFTELHSDSSA
jgi:small multidrug resistance pump